MDKIDAAIVNEIQSDFPVTAQPYLVVAQTLGLTEEEVIRRVKNLRESGHIRRIGGNFFPEKLGHVSTLCAARVPDDKMENFKDVVNAYSGVTHNYERDNDFNVWFTFIAPSRDEIAESLDEIQNKTGVEKILNLPATKVFKISAKFKVGGEAEK